MTGRPIDPEALFRRARAGEWGTVRTELEARVIETPGDFDAWLTLGMLLAEDGATAEARSALARAVAIEPRSLLARVAHASTLPPGEALDELSAARALAPHHRGVLREMARVEAALKSMGAPPALGRTRAAVLDALAARFHAAIAHDAASQIVLRGADAVYQLELDAAGHASALFCAPDGALDPEHAALLSIRLLVEALAMDLETAAALLERLGQSGAPLDANGAQIAFVTREVTPFGRKHGLKVKRAPR